MAAPVDDTYTAASGAGIYGGKYNWPVWRRSIAAQTWGTVPGNTLAAIDPEDNPAINPNYLGNAPWHANGGLPGIMTAWNGMCNNDTELWLPLQGGHADYAGNEPYKINLNAETPTWEMVRNPSGAIGNIGTLNDSQEATGLYFDGRPRAIHSYNKPVYVPNVGPVISVQGNTSWSGQAGPLKPVFIDPVTGEMTLHGAVNSYANTSSGGGACYDPLRHAIWFRGAGTGYFSKYDIAGDSWSQEGTSKAVSGYTALTYLPDYDCILWVNDFFANGFAVYDCATGTLYEPSVSGSLIGMTITARAQPRLIAGTNTTVMWDNGTDTTIINTLSFASNPRTDTWTIAQLAVAGGNAVIPTAKTGNGTYGRFFYSPTLDGFGVINATDQPIYFYARS